MSKRKHRRLHLSYYGGWVAPLQPTQFAGSPQADTPQDTGGDVGGGDVGGGDSGGDGGGAP